MEITKQFDLSVLPEKAQNELYNFYLFLKQQYFVDKLKNNTEDTTLLSEQALAKDWNKAEEDKAWENFQ